MLGCLCHYWLADQGLHHADAEVQLVGADAAIGAAPRLVARIPVHAVVLCAASECTLCAPPCMLHACAWWC
jgi:hypothetical protein